MKLTLTELLKYLLCLTWLLAFSNAWGQEGVGQDYRVSPGDVVTLDTLDDPSGSGKTLRVSRQGYIEHPYMGAFRIGGYTESEASRALEGALREGYLVNPRVRVTVVTYVKMNFVVVGAVNTPGSFEVPANKRITLVQAIAKAGDFKDVANRKKVILRRIVNGRVQPYTFNLKGSIANPNRKPIYLQDGDTIEVPESLF